MVDVMFSQHFAEDLNISRFDVVSLGEQILTFRKNVVFPSSGSVSPRSYSE